MSRPADLSMLIERLHVPQPFMQRQAVSALYAIADQCTPATLGTSPAFSALLKGACGPRTASAACLDALGDLLVGKKATAQLIMRECVGGAAAVKLLASPLIDLGLLFQSSCIACALRHLFFVSVPQAHSSDY
jgi:hypothetical protein